MDWARHDHNIYDKVTHWFSVIGKELHNSTIVPENVYNMDEMGVLLSALGSLKVLVKKEDVTTSRGTAINRTLITAIECISAEEAARTAAEAACRKGPIIAVDGSRVSRTDELQRGVREIKALGLEEYCSIL